MGGGIAQVVAASGRRVSLHDPFPGAIERGLGAMQKSLEKLADKGGAPADAVLARVTPVDELVEADLLIEAVVEDAQTKEDVFRRADETLPEAAILDFARALGKEPAEARDFPGFVSNRILMPFINEAAYALMEGVAEAEAIDTIARLGFAHPIGPLALADLIGLDTCVAIMEVLYSGLGDPKYAPCPLLRQYVQAGRLGRKSGSGFYEY